MKKLVLLSAVIIGLSIVSCEKGALKDLETPNYEELIQQNNAEGEPNPAQKEEPTRGGILKSEIVIPTAG